MFAAATPSANHGRRRSVTGSGRTGRAAIEDSGGLGWKSKHGTGVGPDAITGGPESHLVAGTPTSGAPRSSQPGSNNE